MKKSAQVVMLPTNEKAGKISMGNTSLKLDYHMFPIEKGGIYTNHTYQHLYFLSDEEIKEEDWCYGMDGIFQYKGKINLPDIELPKKIIATTNKSIILPDRFPSFTYLPQPSQSFLEKFVEEYNKGNVITEVMVEYEWNKTGRKIRKLDVFDHILKINPDNTIDINMPKDSWSREEVTTLLYSLNRDKEGNFDCTKWIEENL